MTPRPPKVLFITRKWPPVVGGMETYSVELTTALKERVDLDVRALPGKEDGSPPSAFALAWFFITMAWHLLRYRKRYDVIHFGDFLLFPLAWLHALFAKDIPRILTVHGLDVVYDNRAGLPPRLYGLFLAWARKRNRVIDVYLANSQNTARLAFSKGFTPTAAIPLGVRTPSLGPSEIAPPEEPLYLLYVGRIVPRKGVRWFVDAVMPELPYDITLKIAGDPRQEDELEAARSHPRVEVLGVVPEPELARLRRRALAVIVPNVPNPGETDVEGFGIVALEAAANANVALVADLEGLTDAVVDGKTGFLIPPRDKRAWARRIEEVREWSPERRQKFLQEATRYVGTHYSWARVAEDTAGIYRRYAKGVS